MVFQVFTGEIVEIALRLDLFAENHILGVSVAHIFARTSIAISDIHYPSDRSSTTIA